MIEYVIVGIVSGILFVVMDALINANPLARRLNKVFEPIVKKSINIPIGLTIDIVYGFVMAGLFLILYTSLPGGIGLVKGINFSLIAWFFRVVMNVLSQRMMFNVPIGASFYTLVAGMGEMLVLGIFYGLTLRP